MVALFLLIGVAVVVTSIIALIGWVAGTGKNRFREADDPVDAVLPRRAVKVAVSDKVEAAQEPHADHAADRHPEEGADTEPSDAIVIPLDRGRR